MDYYLIDENKVRLYYENEIVSREPLDYLLYKYGVNYKFDHNLNVIEVSTITENAYAITLDGLVKWKYPVENEFSDKSVKYAEIKKFPDREDREYRFCYSYICLGSIPSSNAISLDANNLKIVAYNSIILDPKYANVSIKENADYMLLEFPDESNFYIGPLVGNILYIIEYVAGVFRFKQIIPRGTCYSTNRVVDYSGKRELPNRVEVCYF